MNCASHQIDRAMEAVAELELTIIEHAQLTTAIEALTKLQARARVKKNGRGLKARALLLLGKSGAGKSTVVEHFEDMNQEVPTPDGTIKPVLVVEVPATPTKRALVAHILGAMGYAAGKEVNSYDIIEDIAAKVRLLGIELIILDEAHHILVAKDSYDVSEFLKSLLNKAGAGIVFAGLPELEALRTSSQLARRLEPTINLRAYDWTDQAERVEFLALLNILEHECIKLPEPSTFVEQSFARRLYAATRGEIGLVTKYISQALLLAVQRQLPCINLELLAEVDAAWHPAVQASRTIAFEDDLDFESDADLEALALDARKVSIDRERNPFVCDSKHLPTIWKDRLQQPQKYAIPNARSGRRARGTGPDEPKAF